MEKLIEQYAALPQQQRLAAAGLLIVALIGGYWYFVHQDETKKLTMLEKQYRDLDQERAQQRAYVANLAKYEARFNELQQDLNDARAMLPSEADVPQLLAQLDNHARQSGLDIILFKPDGEKKKDFYAEVIFDMQVSGSYHEVGTFIDAVAQMDRIVNVLNINMTKPTTENQKILINGQFDIKTYRFIEGESGAKKKKKGNKKSK